MVSILLNGEQKELVSEQTITDLISGLGLEGKRYAVELNDEIVPKSEHGACQLKPGDKVEVVQAIGGG